MTAAGNVGFLAEVEAALLHQEVFAEQPCSNRGSKDIMQVVLASPVKEEMGRALLVGAAMAEGQQEEFHGR
eukprot:2289490-Prorocentrum_lima.AAC.1